MKKSPGRPKSIAILAHPKVQAAKEEAERIAAYLITQRVRTEYGLLDDKSLCQRVTEKEFELIIAIGGDGTMLRASHLCAPLGIPILGINMGRFGFLIEVGISQWPEVLPKIIQGDFWLEQRMMLCAEQWRNDQLLGSWDVVNEAVVSRGRILRPVHLTAYVDSLLLTTFVADGLIVSTPTGSTAYALAAGGPVLPPNLRNILLVPVAPHLSVDRAVVLSEGSYVSISVHTDHHAVLSLDGQDPIELADGDRVDVRASEHTIHFARLQDPGYFYRILTSYMNQRPSRGHSS
ncbi:MAG: NAD(+)/NADH kinase [Chloroflexota bacterium]